MYYPELRAMMARKGFTQFSLAKDIGISHVGMSKRMRKEARFTLDEAKAIKKILGTEMSIDELFQEE